MVLFQGSIASRKQLLHQLHLNAHGRAVVKALRIFVELEARVIEEVWVCRNCSRRQARLDDEVLLERHTFTIDFNATLDEIEKELDDLLAWLTTLRLMLCAHFDCFVVLHLVFATNQVERPEAT